MMTDAGPVFVDSNILVYAAVESSVFNQRSVDALSVLWSRGVRLCISRQVLREFASVLTRPGLFDPPFNTSTACTAVQDLINDFDLLEDGPQTTESWLQLLARFDVQGKQVHDANIIATMLSHKVECLLTHNAADFARYGSLVRLLPLPD